MFKVHSKRETFCLIMLLLSDLRLKFDEIYGVNIKQPLHYNRLQSGSRDDPASYTTSTGGPFHRGKAVGT
jgi:hypothetical protein